jgi:cobalt/nickel transport system ATP-binding protein
VLRDLSFDVAIGERVALVGLNGAGKTSLLLTLMGLAPHDGEIRICGNRLSRRTAPALRRRIGFLGNVPEDQLLFPTALEDVAFGLVRDGLDTAAARERARASLHALGVEHVADHPLHHLSHGQKLRVALAGAIVTGPPVLLLDEPTAGLDPRGRRDLARLLAGQEASQIIATHDLDFVDELCSRVILLEDGTVAAECPTTEAIRRRWLSDPS